MVCLAAQTAAAGAAMAVPQQQQSRHTARQACRPMPPPMPRRRLRHHRPRRTGGLPQAASVCLQVVVFAAGTCEHCFSSAVPVTRLLHPACPLAAACTCRAVLRTPEVEEASKDACAQVGVQHGETTCVTRSPPELRFVCCLGGSCALLALLGERTSPESWAAQLSSPALPHHGRMPHLPSPLPAFPLPSFPGAPNA